MKVSILTFSLTGNTKLVAKRIGHKLSESEKNTVLFFNLVKIGKEIDAVGADKSHLLAGLRSSIESSDVIGLGAFSNFAHPSWRVNEIFTEEILPSKCFRSMKFFFTFATAGQIIARTINVLSTIISDKNRSATFLGSFSAIAPENAPEFLPLKPYRDTWRVSELLRVETFGDQLVKYLDGLERIPPATFKRVRSWEWAVKPGSRFRRFNISKPSFVREKCQQCGTCEKKCPYNACTLKTDIEDGFPVVDRAKCEGCARCFNLCPCEAIEFPSRHTELRSRYPKANTVPVGTKCDDGMISIDFPQGLALGTRMFTGREGTLRTRIAIAILVLVLLIAWIIHKQ
jgi:ferredoxin